MNNSKSKYTGMNELFAQNKKTAKAYKPKKRHIVKPKNKVKRTHHKTNSAKKAHKKSKPKKILYSNIRTKLSTVDKLHGYQVACGFKSRDDLLNEMIKVCNPVLLNSVSKKKKYHKAMKLIHVARELKK